jgi:hypothetical protein
MDIYPTAAAASGCDTCTHSGALISSRRLRSKNTEERKGTTMDRRVEQVAFDATLEQSTVPSVDLAVSSS